MSLGAKTERLLIVRAMANKHNVSVENMLSGCRTRRVSEARWEAFALIKARTDDSYAGIGRFFGVDHTSVMHGIARHFGMQPMGERGRSPKGAMVEYLNIGFAVRGDELRAQATAIFAVEIERRLALKAAQSQEVAHVAA